ncbi:MAG: DUF2189 domain-containing protein [Rhizobiaceae bacterium]|jgi:uncharacterized membrane protein
MSNFHVIAGAGERPVELGVRKIRYADLEEALRRGLDDFMSKPSHYVFLCLIYPLVGVVLAAWTSGNNALPMLFPLMSGFALIGPLAGVGLYEISRRRELGMDTSWQHALEVRHSPAIPSIVAMGVYLLCVFVLWLLAAKAIYVWQFGDRAPASVGAFLHELFTTRAGWMVIVFGNLAGFIFAVVVLATTVIAFPLLLDRDAGAYEAVTTSFRAVMVNPGQMAAWGLIVAVALVIGSIPIFAGLAVVVPILGHATWHLYRRLVEPSAVPVRRRHSRVRRK